MTELAIDAQRPDLERSTVPEDDAPFARVCAMSELPSRDPDIGRYAGEIAPVWTIGDKVHGGTMVAASAAAAAARLRVVAPTLSEMFPIAASTDFLGAPDPGQVEYEVRVRKTGRQICLVDASLVQGGRPLVHTAFTFGHLDDAAPAYAGDAAADMPAEPPADAIRYTAGTMGNFVHVSEGASMALDRQYAAFLRGERGEPQLRLWIRPRAADERDPEIAAYFAMMAGDVSPPVPMNLGNVGWAPTVQMTTYLRRSPAPGWLRVVATAQEIGERMFDEDQLVLDSTGALVAQSRQLALIPR